MAEGADAMTSAPLAIDLFCGLGGWTEGLLAEGYDVVGFDNVQHIYGEHRYPAQLVLQDVLTLHGRQFKDAALIVASPPCQAYSWRAMPWKAAKAAPPPDNSLFESCFRIQKEACAAAGRHVPMVVENVKGAQPWVGRAAWHYGSYYLWGDVPALMPMTLKAQKFNPDGTEHGQGSWFKVADSKHRGVKCAGQKHGTEYAMTRGPVGDGIKQRGSGAEWFDGPLNERRLVKNTAAAHRADMIPMLHQGKTTNNTRKAASAQIAKIPFPLSSHIARVFKP